MADGVAKFIDLKAENEFRLTADDLRAAITDRTKILVMPFPNNPTGSIMPRKELEEIAQVVIENDLIVVSDEIYAELTYYDEPHVSIASLPGMKERTLLLNGFSKTFAMTGWRLGYACGPAELIKQMTKLHQFGIMSASAFSMTEITSSSVILALLWIVHTSLLYSRSCGFTRDPA